MRLNIIDPNTLELAGVLTQYESAQWEIPFNEPNGSFQISCSPEYVNLLRLHWYVENTEEMEHVGVIKRIETVSSNAKSSLLVTGVLLESDIFSKRIIPAWITYESLNPTSILANIIGLAMTAPADPKRKIDKIGEVIIPVGSSVADMKKDNYSSNFANLGDEVFNILKNLNLGVKARINRDTNKIDIEFYTGNDLTYGGDNPIVLSPERGTVLETDYTKDCSQYINMLTVVGSNNVIVQGKRTGMADEPLVEKSIDLSSELPWPSYRVEKPEDEGGQYYRYKKRGTSAGFIANRDVWERYNVNRIDTTERNYDEIFVETEEEISIKSGDFSGFLEEAEILSGVSFDSKNGFRAGSIVDMGTALKDAIAKAKTTGNVTEVGSLINRRIPDLGEMENSVVVQDPDADFPPLEEDEDFEYEIEEEPLKVPSNLTASFGDALLLEDFMNSLESGIDSNQDSIMSFSVKVPKNFNLDALNPDKKVSAQKLVKVTKERQIKEKETTITTYEIKDFLEYVYVNRGKKPSQGSKLIKGSLASGNVIYYENFQEVKIAEPEYREMLMHKLQQYLKTFVISENVEVKPYMLSGYRYKKDYDLGDIVTAKNKKMGYAVDLRISRVTQTWDNKGHTLSISLGENIPTLTNRIKLISKGG